MTNDYKEEEFLSKFAHHLAKTREDKGFTQEQLAAEAGIDRVALANIETGRRRPTLRTVYRLSRALKIPLKVLFASF